MNILYHTPIFIAIYAFICATILEKQKTVYIRLHKIRQNRTVLRVEGTQIIFNIYVVIPKLCGWFVCYRQLMAVKDEVTARFMQEAVLLQEDGGYHPTSRQNPLNSN